MTRAETTAIMAVLSAAYPRFYAGKTDDEIDMAIALWAEMFADESAKEVTAAVKAFISTDEKGFPPHIGAIKAYIAKLRLGQEKTEQEAWADVQKALRNSAYGYTEEFAKLDAVIQRIVGSPAQLREWSMMDLDTLNSVVASNFQRSYRAIVKAQREYATLPENIKKLYINTPKQGLVAISELFAIEPSDRGAP